MTLRHAQRGPAAVFNWAAPTAASWQIAAGVIVAWVALGDWWLSNR